MLPLILGATAVTASALVLWWALSGHDRRSPGAARLLAIGLPPATDLREAVLAHSATERAVQPAVGYLARQARRLTPARRLDALERRIVLAGGAQSWPLERVLAAKVTLGLAAAVLGGLRLLADPGAFGLAFLAFVTGLAFMLPDLLLINQAQKRQKAVRKALPDTLDQLTVMVEAGLGFDAAMARSARTNTGPLAEELTRTLQDVQAGMTRREALRGLSDRVDVPEMGSFVTAVVQAEQYGVPLAQVLRVQAGELRLKRSQRAEEQAMKLPVKLLFPTIMFIFPVLFIVLLGPAALQISRGLLGG